ncbi:MAG TPA: hypothetical protein PKD00_01730 [Burkholderiales bacterium]|nr:hypothetical protein [Burkholderiales bacterium]
MAESKTQYYINAGEIKTTKPPASDNLNQFRSLDNIVCDILKCKFGMDCCTGDSTEDEGCCVQFGTGEVDCDTFTGTYYIDGNGVIWTCIDGDPTGYGQMLINTGGDITFQVSDSQAFEIERNGTNGETGLYMIDAPNATTRLKFEDGDDLTQLEIYSENLSLTCENTTDDTGITLTPTYILVEGLGDYVDDAAAALASIPIGGLYHTSGALKIRLV